MVIKETTEVDEPEAEAQPETGQRKKDYARLTTLFIEALKAPGRYPDKEVKNLYLYVSKTGSKTWQFIYKHHGRQREAGFGNFRDVPLKAARERATEGRRLLAEGKDPIEHWRSVERTSTPAPTFAKAADAYIEARQAAWRSEKHVRVTRLMLIAHAKGLMNLRVDEITAADVAAVMKPLIKAGKVPTALRLRGHIERTLSAMIALGHVPGLNPARWKDNIKHLAPTPDKGVEHFAAMDYEKVPDFIRRLREQRRNDDGSINIPAYALDFCILTATRRLEALGARWSEIDRHAKVWRLPKERMKAGRVFEVPLSGAAMEIVEAMAAIEVEGCPFVFHGVYKSTPRDGKTFWRVLRRMGEADTTTHGFRSSFRDWAGNETSTPRDICEMALAHKVGDATERAYRRKDSFAKRRLLMESWAAHCGSAPPAAAGDNVVRFKAQA
jgi:integrase